MSSIRESFLEQDIYGHGIGVHYRGSDAYKTNLGACCTLATYVLILFNLSTMTIGFFDNSMQDEKTQFSVIDIFDVGTVDLRENHIDLAFLVAPPMDKSIGRLNV